MDRRHVLMGSGAVALAGTVNWTSAASAQRRPVAQADTASIQVFPPFDERLRGTYELHADAITMRGSLVPL